MQFETQDQPFLLSHGLGWVLKTINKLAGFDLFIVCLEL
jgi:hypothetical protein